MFNITNKYIVFINNRENVFCSGGFKETKNIENCSIKYFHSKSSVKNFMYDKYGLKEEQYEIVKVNIEIKELLYE